MSGVVELNTFYKNIDKVPEGEQNVLGHFNIFRIEDILMPSRKKVTYTRRSFFKVSLITGHNKLHYADKTIEVNGTALVFTNPAISYFWDRISEAQIGYMCIFTEPFFNRYGNIKDYPVFQYVDAAVVPLDEAEVPLYNALFTKMFSELQGDYIYRYDLLRNLLMEVVHAAQKKLPSLGTLSIVSNGTERLAALFAELLERQFPIELTYQVIRLSTPSAFAEQLHVHVNHLNKVLKAVTGHTTSQLIGERILQEAKVLLKSTNWTIAEIAFSLGFEEANHFSAFFKNRAQITANKYRLANID